MALIATSEASAGAGAGTAQRPAIRGTPQQEAFWDRLKTGNAHLMLEARAGTGKCLGAGTPVMKHDGSIVPVEAIAVGDTLMGPDSLPRRVLSLSRGVGRLYRIVPTKGASWVCNENHILTLRDSVTSRVFDIPLPIYLRERKSVRLRDAKLFRTKVSFPEQETPIEPYLLGVWLGDGSLAAPIITNPEPEIREYLEAVTSANGLVCRIAETTGKSPCPTIALVQAGGKSFRAGKFTRDARNFFGEEFSRCIVANEKRIPTEYLVNSSTNRLELLAGLIDTDGHLASNCYEIITKYAGLRDDILFLARSLGLAAYATAKRGTIKERGFEGWYWRIWISGDVDQIPCRVTRKKASPRRQKKNVTNTGFVVDAIEDGDYFGFTLDGDGRFLLGDCTVTHNSTSCAEGMHRIPGRPRITYCAFNKHIATEFQAKAPGNCRAATMHSLGFGAIRDAMGDVAVESYKSETLAERYFPDRFPDRPNRAAVAHLVSLCKNLLNDGQNPDTLRSLAAIYGVSLGDRREEILAVVPEVLRESREHTAAIDFDDMIWLPVVLGLDFARPADFLFVDEAQDTNLCQMALMAQLSPAGRRVAVGDTHQCQPAGTMVVTTGGERKPIEDLLVGDQVVSYCRPSAAMVGRSSQGRKVTAKAVRSFTGMLHTIAVEHLQTRCTPNHKWITRFAERDTNLNVVYLMRRTTPGGGHWYRVGWCQLFTQDGGSHLAQRARVERADAAWILSVHESKTEASIGENIVAARFGLPTLPFHPVEGANHITAHAIDTTFERLAHYLPKRAEECLASFGRSIEHPFYTVDFQQRQGRTTIFVTQACNLIPGLMMVPTYTGDREPMWLPIDSTDAEPVHELPVYSLQIEDNETYVADGLVTHNSIYAFRGADSDAMNAIGSSLEATDRGLDRLPLTITWRCPSSHVWLANAIVPDLEASPSAIEGEILERDEADALDAAAPGDMVLCRTNAPLVGACYRLLRSGRRAVVRGWDIGKGLLTLVVRLKARDVADLIGRLEDYRVREVSNLNELRNPGPALIAMHDRVDCLRAMCDGCKAVDEVKARIESLFSDDDERGAVVFSSIHRAKGLERDAITILRPDLLPHPAAKSAAEIRQEGNLAYVAVTRSKRILTFAGEVPAIFGCDDQARPAGFRSLLTLPGF